jgi:hypothetical protein
MAVGRELGAPIPASGTKDAQLDALASSPALTLPGLLRSLGRDELRAACRAHGLDDSGRSRPALLARLLEAAGSDAAAPALATSSARRARPEAGDIVQVRHRQYLVEQVVPPGEPDEASRLVLAGLDDDNQGRRLEVLWEIELGARILQPELHGPDTQGQLDPPRAFAAYLNALRWNAVTATDARLFQAPFRAGIKLIGHQLTPLKRALDLPRANLFIADDVGLGKTVEAGLVLQELALRQQVDFALVICPASLCLQWRDEMERRFGLRFEIYNRAFVARRRQERGFAVNPWTTHNRFVISYQVLRRPEYREPLLLRLGDESKVARKSLLILDEAHTAAPASASLYAVDSRLTRVIQDVAPRFEHRLFLSATPHNGHSNSFSALLNLLDPQRFTRGVKVERGQLDKIMVRRLKSDLRELGVEGYPVRRLVQLDLTHDAGVWHLRARQPDGFAADGMDLGQAEPVELRLSTLLAEYTVLMRPRRNKRGQLVFINLQKRLLSSIEAFYRTLKLHADHVGAEPVVADSQQSLLSPEDDEYGQDEEAVEAVAGAEIATASRRIANPEGRAREILDEMLQIAERWRHLPDAKVLALLSWIRQNQCPGAIPGRTAKDRGRAALTGWLDRRVLVFTEYGDTERYLHRMLTAAIEGTDDSERRILKFHGGMSDETRDEVQRAFNAPPDEHPVRILLATDAAREGVNLQGHCADLFHFDIPWNPARLEQRNGRIDRTLQREPEVRCHYFSYEQREEDRVLEVVVAKVQTIQKELGSLSAVLMDRYAEILDRGIGPDSRAALEEADPAAGRREAVREELESERADLRKLRREIDAAGRILDRSREALEFDPDLLREAVDAGLVLAQARPLIPLVGEAGDGPPAYVLPDLPESWQGTLDTLRPPRRKDEPFWDWRRRPLLPVVFRPLDRLDGSRVHLHLQHPFVQRLLSRFLAQGYGAHDLSRVTAVRDPYGAQVVVLVFGRLSLFGPKAARLHDQIVAVAAPWLEAGGPEHLRPWEGAAESKALDRLNRILRELPPEGDPFAGVSERVRERLRASAPSDFAALWPHVEAEAEALAHEAERKLVERGATESDALRGILRNQKGAIQKALAKLPQLLLPLTPTEPQADKQIRQIEQDRGYMEGRLLDIDREIETEPAAIQELYRVVLTRREPVGMVYLWPEVRG